MARKDRAPAYKITGLKDFSLLYYSIIKDQCCHKQNLRSDFNLQRNYS